MPLGYERLNERSQRPNQLINFIKPLTSSTSEDQKIAQNFLERIAAQCYPVMKKEYISVMALEEYPPNPEFLGRNFNAGEVIQLVLKDKAGRWLSFKFVQMVMMHELAHCKQMNHSRFFWNERNKLAAHMEELWAAKYKGEGLWGRGQDLDSGNFVGDRMPDDVQIPEHLCGGTYRRGRGRKRKRGQEAADKPKLTYAERQQKRIAKKFGIHGDGQNLGEDDLVRGALEQGGKRHYGKPRVAQSKRGRELRANAALARFEAAKQEQVTATPSPVPEDDDGSETESESDDYADGLNIFETLERIKDQKGRDLYKVCGDEGEQDEGGQAEMEELQRLGKISQSKESDVPAAEGSRTLAMEDQQSETENESDVVTQPNGTNDPHDTPVSFVEDSSHTEVKGDDLGFGEAQTVPQDNDSIPAIQSAVNTVQVQGRSVQQPSTTTPNNVPEVVAQSDPHDTACPICSLDNEPAAVTCAACSHVLKPKVMHNHWRCSGIQCMRSKYINAGDVGRCGLCGSQKPTVQQPAMGITNGDVLRWD